MSLALENWPVHTHVIGVPVVIHFPGSPKTQSMWKRVQRAWQYRSVQRQHQAQIDWEQENASKIPEGLWTCVAQRARVDRLDPDLLRRLRALSAALIARKQFTGAHGFEITDEIALTIALQASLPLLHWLPSAQALSWYDDFVGIVVHADAVVARRKAHDGALVHEYSEVLAGEAMDRGPIMLSWADIQRGLDHPERGQSVTVHEFVHKLDLRDGQADGCPPLPEGFLGHSTHAGARREWLTRMRAAHEQLIEQHEAAERFGAASPWLDAYGTASIEEFFPVACEAYFIAPQSLERDFPDLFNLLAAFFNPTMHLNA